MKHPKLYYLASPYSHDNPKMRQTRLVKIGKVAANLFKQGYHIFPVMSATASIAKYGKIENTFWENWKDLDCNYLSRCDAIIITCLDKEWYKSVGMLAELMYAKENNIPAFITGAHGNIVLAYDHDEIIDMFKCHLENEEPKQSRG